MMKRNILAVVIPALLVAGAANAAEIYNKNGNKLDFYGKMVGEHVWTTNGDTSSDDSLPVLICSTPLRDMPSKQDFGPAFLYS